LDLHFVVTEAFAPIGRIPSVNLRERLKYDYR